VFDVVSALPLEGVKAVSLSSLQIKFDIEMRVSVFVIHSSTFFGYRFDSMLALYGSFVIRFHLRRERRLSVNAEPGS